MIEIPSGEYLIGTNEQEAGFASDREGPQVKVTLPAF